MVRAWTELRVALGANPEAHQVLANMREAWREVPLDLADREEVLAHIEALQVAANRLTPGMKLVVAERQRQIEVEGWTPEHDREHTQGELAQAAGCYALSPMSPEPPAAWPWDARWWKPVSGNALRPVVKAAALLVAELDRLLAEE